MQASEADMAAMNHVEEWRRLLAEARRRIVRDVALTDEELATLEGHQPGAPTEDATRELVEGVLSRLEGREKHELDEIDAAQARLEAGTYGVCEGCGQTIMLARLRAVPTTRFCVPCQTEVERIASKTPEAV
jgi:RNA polymerase-binding transcription factor